MTCCCPTGHVGAVNSAGSPSELACSSRQCRTKLLCTALAHFVQATWTIRSCRFWVSIGHRVGLISYKYKEIHYLSTQLVGLHSTVYFSDKTLNYSEVTLHGLWWSLRVRLPQSSYSIYGSTSDRRGLTGEYTCALCLCLAPNLTTRRMQNWSHSLDAWSLGPRNDKAEYLTRCTNFHITLASLHYSNSLHAGMTACCRVMQICLNFSITTSTCRKLAQLRRRR